MIEKEALSIDHVRCNLGIESIDHALRLCPMAKAVWGCLMKGIDPTFFEGSFRTWLFDNLFMESRAGISRSVFWCCLLGEMEV